MGNPKVVAASGATYTKLADQREDVVTSLADSGAPEGVFAPRDYDLSELRCRRYGRWLFAPGKRRYH